MHGIYATTQIGFATPAQDTIINYVGKENNHNVIKVDGLTAVTGYGEKVTINLENTDIYTYSQNGNTIALRSIAGSVVNTKNVSIISSDENTDYNSVSAVLARNQDGIINFTGNTFIDATKTKNSLALKADGTGSLITLDGTATINGDILAQGEDTYISLNLTNSSTFSGKTTIDSNFNGKIDLNLSNSNWNVTGDSILSTLVLTNDSIVKFISEDNSYYSLTINENYKGDNGTIILNAQLEGDSSFTDRLVVKGNTNGTTKVKVRNLGGNGAETINGIELITVLGNSEGEFIQDGRIVAGAYDYFLNRGNNVTTDMKNWYLSSNPSSVTPPVTPPIIPIYRPESGSYLANAEAVNSLFIHTLHDRLGETQYTDVLNNEKRISGIWVRNNGGYNTFRDGSNQLKNRNKKNVIQVGGDIIDWSSNGSNRYRLGLMAGYGFNHSKSESNRTSYTSTGKTEGFNLGIYGTYYGNKNDKSGFYADTWVTYSWFDNEVHGEELEKEKYKSKGITASLESGYSFKIENDVSYRKTYYIQPKAQIIYMDVDTDNHTESNGTKVETKGDGNIQTRIGARIYANHFNSGDRDNSKEIQPFVEGNWIHNSKDIKISMDDVNNKIKGIKNTGEVKIGTEIKLNPNFNLWTNIAQQWGKNNYRDSRVTIGVKYSF